MNQDVCIMNAGCVEQARSAKEGTPDGIEASFRTKMGFSIEAHGNSELLQFRQTSEVG